MFSCKSWADAFINSLETGGGEIEDGLDTLKAFASWAASVPGAPSGRHAAEKLEPLIRKAIPAAGQLSFAQETALRFFLLLVKKNKIRHIDSVIGEINNVLSKKRGEIKVRIEYAFPPSKEFKLQEFESLIGEAIKKRTGASRVEITGQVKPELIGGYRLRLGDELIDASVRSQLQKMEECLTGDGGNQW